MKLIECYVESFGKLKDFSYTFDRGLNVINEENGFGKTTLSVFIKSMLFGLEDTKKKGIFENDRRRYLSWDSGKAGGTLTFSQNGKTYRIERSFKPKASDDSFALYDIESGRISEDFGKNLGEELFEIDADGFERSLFLSERNLSTKNDNDKISAKISNLVGVDGDVGGIDDAIDALEERRKYYYKKGGSGRIADTRAEIVGTEQRISSILRDEQLLIQKNSELSELSLAIEKARKKVEKARYLEKSKAQRELIASKKSELADAVSLLADVDRFFEKGTPGEEDIRRCEAAIYESAHLKDKINKTKEALKNKDLFKAELDEADAALNACKEEEIPKKEQKKPLPVLLFLSPLPLIIGVSLAFAVSIYCLLISVLSLPLLLLGITQSKKRASENDKHEEIPSSIDDFIRRHGKECKPDERLAALIEIRARICAALSALSEKEDEMQNDAERLSLLENERDSFLSLFSVGEEDPISRVRTMLAKKKSLGERIKGINEDLSKLTEGYAEADEGIDPIDLVASEEKLRTLTEEIALKSRECDALRQSASRIDEERILKEELEDRLASESEKLRIIQLTKEHLLKAKEALTAKYLGKTREAFSKYIAILAEDDGARFTMDTSFALMRSEGAESKTVDAYSLGTRELYSLAMRLALIDSLYTNETPFIILDDPFAHFDDKNAKKALGLIKALAEEKQIIYFTCSKARTV